MGRKREKLPIVAPRTYVYFTELRCLQEWHCTSVSAGPVLKVVNRSLCTANQETWNNTRRTLHSFQQSDRQCHPHQKRAHDLSGPTLRHAHRRSIETWGSIANTPLASHRPGAEEATNANVDSHDNGCRAVTPLNVAHTQPD